MTKTEFKKRWESNADGGGITLDMVANCASAWGVVSCPRTKPPAEVLYRVLKAANTKDAEEFKPEKDEEL
jgi:hypothetical protein